jgi:hypothetical protein
MDFRKLRGIELSAFARNVLTLLAGNDLPAINDNIRTNLVSAIGVLPDDLAEQANAAFAAETQRMAAISVRRKLDGQLHNLMSQVKKSLDAGLATNDQYELCGFDPRVNPVSRYVPQNPTDLSVSMLSSGLIKGKFAGNNKKNRVFYEVWRRENAIGEWIYHIATRKRSFIEILATPGQHYEYKVRAVAAASVSNFSNTAIVNGKV